MYILISVSNHSASVKSTIGFTPCNENRGNKKRGNFDKNNQGPRAHVLYLASGHALVVQPLLSYVLHHLQSETRTVVLRKVELQILRQVVCERTNKHSAIMTVFLLWNLCNGMDNIRFGELECDLLPLCLCFETSLDHINSTISIVRRARSIQGVIIFELFLLKVNDNKRPVILINVEGYQGQVSTKNVCLSF